MSERLPFQLADWTRLIWMSEEARATWAPRINNMNEAWARIERWAVVERARASALTFFEPSYLPEATAWAARHGLVLLPMAQVGLSDQYSATPKAVEKGARWQYRAVLTRPDLAKDWIEAWQDTGKGGRYNGTNNRALGALLGYPQCCIDFFEKTWVGEGSVDTTWDMAVNTLGALETSHDVLRLASPPETNILLRWLGVRLVAHLPCSFNCEGTIAMAQSFAEVGRKRQFGEWVDWMYEMLEWPVEWSALHGIAEIRTPIVTINSRTNATSSKIVVQREGYKYPEEGASGLSFPYRIVKGKVTDKPSFKRSLTPVHELNGFGSEKSMVAAHDTLLQVLPSEPGFLIDLGCGTGRFLERAEERGWTVTGVENDNTRAGAAKVRVKRSDLLDVGSWDGQFDVIAFMPGRLIEAEETRNVEECRQALRTRAKYVLFYAYGDWLTKYGSLDALIERAGMSGGRRWAESFAYEKGVSAVLVEFNPQEI